MRWYPAARLILIAASLLAPRQARPQAPTAWRSHLNPAFGASFYISRPPNPDTLTEALAGIGLAGELALSFESPEHQLSAHLAASLQRYIPLLICIDGCPSSGIPTAVAGLRLGARWRSPDPPLAFLAVGLGFYAPVGRSPHWRDPAPGIDLGFGLVRYPNRGESLECRLVW